MSASLDVQERPTRARAIMATVLVVLTVIGAWKFIDYRTQPPPPPVRKAPAAVTPP